MLLQRTNLLERTWRPNMYELSSVSWSQLEPGVFETRCGFLEAGPIILSTRSYNLGLKAAANLVPGTSIIAVTADTRTRARCLGNEFGSSSINLARTSNEVSTIGASWFCSIMFDEERLARDFATTPDVLALLNRTQRPQLAEDPLYSHRLRTSILRVLSLAFETAESMVPLGVRENIVYGALVPLALEALERVDAHRVEASRCLTKRLAAVRVCEDYIHANSSEPVTLLDLSRVSGMTSRSLVNAFEAATGFAPVDYLKRVRLSGVRRALLLADEKVATITEVATSWGFWHLGHFARNYRKMFGETPSQTLLNRGARRRDPQPRQDRGPAFV